MDNIFALQILLLRLLLLFLLPLLLLLHFWRNYFSFWRVDAVICKEHVMADDSLHITMQRITKSACSLGGLAGVNGFLLSPRRGGIFLAIS